jgi:hypothetical protein
MDPCVGTVCSPYCSRNRTCEASLRSQSSPAIDLLHSASCILGQRDLSLKTLVGSRRAEGICPPVLPALCGDCKGVHQPLRLEHRIRPVFPLGQPILLEMICHSHISTVSAPDLGYVIVSPLGYTVRRDQIEEIDVNRS